MRGALACLAAAALVTAGCLRPGTDDEGTAQTADDDASSTTATLPALRLEGQDCREAGGHSVHPKMLSPLPEPWVAADVIEDVGPQLLYSEVPDPTRPVPEEGNTLGNYHATMECASWAFDGEAIEPMVFGFVGMKNEEPPFGDGAPVRQYVITVLAADNEAVLEALHHAGFHSTSTAGYVRSETGGVVHTLLDTADHGVFESAFLPKEMGAAPEGVYRLWWQLENEDGTFTPIALDMAKVGGTHFAAEGQGYFSHLGTEDHWPLPGAGGHTAALGYEGFDVVITLGPRPDERLPEAYIHA